MAQGLRGSNQHAGNSAHLFELLVSNLSNPAIVLSDEAGRFASWNPAVFDYFGYTEEEFIGQDARLLLPREERSGDHAEKLLQDGAATGASSRPIWLERKDGARLLVEHTIFAIRDGAGSVSAYGNIFRKMSDREGSAETDAARLHMQGELETAHSRLDGMTLELERSNRELEEFARIASHDLSAPIISTRWLVELLSSRHAVQLDDEGRKLLTQISLSLERMSDMVEAVLSHARVGRSAISSRSRTPADEAWNAAVQNLQKDIQTTGVTITHDELPELLIEPQALTQLFQNLLSNAIKYRREHVPAEIRVTAARQGSVWLMGVQDNGMGIEKEWFERIFQPFQRHHGLEIGGSGLGLATCKKIVNRAGGRIWVESKLGEGSTFYFTLPAPASTNRS